ncbi:hypothetical protein [Cellulomonas denverensis]|uniref:DUF2975 domain-containing protein n=1 Tax=Cellulomonas denverensis TaxID=264297 RepID=A0A7X6R0Y8_9CELL|nr:hypothetical protein [Cellulomonas denverensis]NKY24626.1 hypothetical protein [Cellulomonas denverensis]GIG25682.1 hypothetical protein Cde04nite_19260 [Cellulomonas denverensis]
MRQTQSWLARAGDQWSVLVFGAIVVVWNLIVLVRGLIPLFSEPEVDVTVLLSGAELPLPIGPGGTPVAAGVSSAQVAVSDLGPFMMIWAVGAVAVVPLATIAVAVLVLILSRNILRGQFFSRTNTWIITSISLVIAGAWVLDLGCTLFTSNWALVQVAGPEGADAFSPHSVIEDTPTAWLPIFAAIAMGALAAAFSAGERMQRDTEGLV